MDIGRKISRRQALGVLGAGIGYIALPKLGSFPGIEPMLAATNSASLTPELTEGPYWVNTMLHRFDVRANTASATSPGVVQAGVLLQLAINVFDASKGFSRLNGVAVDIWHTNAEGLYSDETGQQTGGATVNGNTAGENFLRGYQITGKDPGVYRAPTSGQVSFRTIWPGWYEGRAIHIHVRVRRLSQSGATIAGYTTQIFFSDTDNDRVLTGAAPYNRRTPQKNPTTDENDSVLQASDFATNVVPVSGSISKGFKTTFDIKLTDSETTTQGSLARPSGSGAGGPGSAPPA